MRETAPIATGRATSNAISPRFPSNPSHTTTIAIKAVHPPQWYKMRYNPPPHQPTRDINPTLSCKQDPEGELADMGLDLSSVRGVSVSGQQHGTVYWAKGAGEKLQAMATAATPATTDDAKHAGGDGV